MLVVGLRYEGASLESGAVDVSDLHAYMGDPAFHGADGGVDMTRSRTRSPRLRRRDLGVHLLTIWEST